MITIFISRQHTYTVTPYLETWPSKAASSIGLYPYQYIHRIRSVQPGIMVFSDIDRLTPSQKHLTMSLCDYISDSYGEQLIFNHPGRVLTRYNLLSRLWKDGINHYRVFLPLEHPETIRFPVFVRRTHDHDGPLTDLIADKQELDERLHSLRLAGEDLNQLIIIEFCDTRSDDSIFRKYSAFRIGDRIIPGHIIFSSTWVAKDSPPEPLRQEEEAFLADNPHRDELMHIFRLAHIDYGRIDYGLLNGKIQVWEINTNPVLIQQRDRYAIDKLPVKQRLVDRLSDSFQTAALRAGDIQAKPVQETGQLSPFGRLSLPQRLDRFFNRARL